MAHFTQTLSLGSSVLISILITLATEINLSSQNPVPRTTAQGNGTSGIPETEVELYNAIVQPVELSASLNVSCNPLPHTRSVSQYVIGRFYTFISVRVAMQSLSGYGSLMNTESKDRTYPNTGESIPVKINGYSRVWNSKGTDIGLSTTYLGAIVDDHSSINAIIFKLPVASALTGYDTREFGYCRHEVPASQIQMLSSNLSQKEVALGQYWIYVTKPDFDKAPSADFPVVQSYVDVFLSGCLELEEKFGIVGFAKECVTSTKGWDSPWVNDRIFPRRPFVYQPKSQNIDMILKELVPEPFQNIRIE